VTGRRRRLAATVLATATVIALLGTPIPPAGSRTRLAQPTPTVAPAIQELADCLLASNRLLLLMLVDESGSLAETDPSNQRVVAAKAALSGVAALPTAEYGGRRPAVEVQLAGFSDDFRAATGWTRLDAGSLPRLEAQVDGFTARNRGLDTDFATALQGAQASLADRAAVLTRDGSAPPCQALVLFTDGNYDIQPRHVTRSYANGMYADTPQLAARMVALGRAEICRPEGLADQLRRDRVTSFTVALTGRIGAGDRQFLRSMTDGSGGGRACGRRDARASGLYLGVAGRSDLVETFDDLVNRLPPGWPVPPAPPSTRLPFRVDRGLRRFHLLIDLGEEGVAARLRSPGSDGPIVLDRRPRGSGTLGTVRVSYGWLSPTALTVDATLPRATSDWAGRWLVSFTDPTGRAVPAGSRIYLFGDLFPALAETPDWRRGEPARVAVRVVDGAGTPRTPAGFVRSAGLEAVVTDPATRARTPVELSSPEPDGVAHGSWPVPESLDSSQVNLTVRLSVTTSSGLALAPVSRTWVLPVKPPVTYPSVERDQPRLSSVTDREAAEGTLTLTGGRAGAGCVWFDGATFSSAPASAGRIKVTVEPAATSQGRCLHLRAGARRTIKVSATPDGSGTGTVEGVLVAKLRSDADSGELTVQVPISFSMARPPDPFKRLLFLLILLGGIALPLAALYLLNLGLARFAPTDLLRAARVPVLVAGDRVHRRTADGGIEALVTELRPDEFANVEAGSPVRLRSLVLGPLWLRTRVPRLPFTAPYGEAAADGHHVTAGEGRLAGRPHARGRLPLELGGTWVFVLEEPARASKVDEADGERVDGTLYALLDEPIADQGERLAEAVQRDLPAAAQELAAVAAAARPPGGEDTGPEDGDLEPEPQEPVPAEPDY
jgi:hypothetical protein